MEQIHIRLLRRDKSKESQAVEVLKVCFHRPLEEKEARRVFEWMERPPGFFPCDINTKMIPHLIDAGFVFSVHPPSEIKLTLTKVKKQLSKIGAVESRAFLQLAIDSFKNEFKRIQRRFESYPIGQKLQHKRTYTEAVVEGYEKNGTGILIRKGDDANLVPHTSTALDRKYIKVEP